MTEDEKTKKAIRNAAYDTRHRTKSTLPDLRKDLEPLEAETEKYRALLEKATEKRDAKRAEILEQEFILKELDEASEILKTAQLGRDSGLPGVSEEEELSARERISRYTGVNSITSPLRSALRNGY